MSSYKFLCIFLIVFGSRLISSNAGEIPLPKKSGISFKENKGQIGDQFSHPRADVLFSGNSGNLVFHLRNSGVSYQMYRVDSWNVIKDESAAFHLHKHVGDKTPAQTTIYRLDIDWIGANINAQVLKQDQLPGTDNYYTEVCPNGVFNVGSYKSVVYKSLYNGIDLKWYEKNGNLKYDYIVAPGADHSQIKLNFKGASKLLLNKKGELVIETPLGKLTEQAPLVIQGGRKLKANWTIDKDVVSFHIEGANSSEELVIDPLVRLWGTYYGGSLDDALWYSAIDASGNIYASGASESSNNIATVGAHQTTNGGSSNGWDDAILVKFNAAGVRQWATYYGGSGGEYGNQCALDPTGNFVCMVGGTTSSVTGVIATPGSHQPIYGGTLNGNSGDMFVVLFNNTGVRQWGTYYGGAADDWGQGCTFDINGNIFITSQTSSTNNIASPGSHQPTFGGWWDGVLAKFDISGTRLWGTYYGGTGYEGAWTCTADQAGNVYMVGNSQSQTNISTPGAHQQTFAGSSNFWGDGFVAKFNAAGTRLWGTYYGGAGDDWLYNCVLDVAGDIYLGGTTTAPSQFVMTTPGSHQTTFGGGSYDAFLLKMTPAGTRIWCTFYGGPGGENWNWCGIDPADNVYLVGLTTSANAIATPCAYQTTYGGGGGDAYMAKFNASGTRLWGTYYGGIGYDDYATCSTDQSGNIYLTGGTSSQAPNVMSSAGSHQPVYGGGNADGYLVKFNGCVPALPPNTTNPANLEVCQGRSTVLTTSATCNLVWFNSAVGGNPIGTGATYSTSNLVTTTSFYVAETSCGTNTLRTMITVTVKPAPNFSIAAIPDAVCAGGEATLTPIGATNGFTWTVNNSLNTTNPSSAIATPSTTQTYFITGDDGVCVGSGSVMVTVVPTPTVNLGSQILYVCSGKTATLTAQGATSYTWSPASSINLPNASVVQVTPLSNTTYTVIGANSSNSVTCADTRTVTVYVVPYLTNATISPSVAICLGQQATLNVYGGAVTTWAPIDNMDDPNGAEVHVASPVTTVYSVSVSDNGLCPVTRTVLVQVNPIPVIDAGRDTTFNINEPMHIAAVSNGTVTWVGGPSIYCKHCLITQVFPNKNACYTAEAINEFGCTVTDEVCIEITKDHLIYIPNSFTPNNDQLNDEFKVYGDGITLIKMAIYDRWGKEVYFKEGEDAMWNGTYQGEVCEEGVYIYRFLYRAISGQKIYKMGSLTLLKD